MPKIRQQPQRPLKVFLPLALPFAVLAAVAVFAALTPYHGTPGPAPGEPGALVWGDGIFANKVELRAWMRLHGGSYAQWSRQHPAAFRLVTRRASAPVRTKSKRVRHQPAIHRQKGPSAAASRTPTTGKEAFLALAWLAACGALAAILVVREDSARPPLATIR